MSNLDLPKLPPLWGVSTGPDRGRVKLMRSAPMAGPDYIGSNAIEIELAKHWNGSGPSAFGGARSWPHLKLSVSFPVGGDAKRSEFVRKLKHFIDENL